MNSAPNYHTLAFMFSRSRSMRSASHSTSLSIVSRDFVKDFIFHFLSFEKCILDLETILFIVQHYSQWFCCFFFLCENQRYLLLPFLVWHNEPNANDSQNNPIFINIFAMRMPFSLALSLYSSILADPQRQYEKTKKRHRICLACKAKHGCLLRCLPFSVSYIFFFYFCMLNDTITILM